MSRPKSSQASAQPRVALYARISQDDSGESLGVTRQLDDLRAMAKDRGWNVVAEIHDNDVSAYSGAKRPGYEQLLDLVRAGVINRVAVWHMSRLWRNRPQRVAAQDLFRDRNVGVIAVTGPELDFSTATGRMLAELLSAFDAYESDLKGERVARATLQRVRSGRHAGDLGYGWTKRKDGSYGLDRAQAKVVRDIVARVIAGESVRGITEDLNRRGVTAPGLGQNRGDGTWGRTSVRKVALRPSNAGLVVHQGDIVGEASWPAIITLDDHEAVKRALAARPAGNPTGSSTRKHLLSSSPVAVCGICGEQLRSVTRKGKYGAPITIYVCDGKGCVGRKQAPVDELVTGVVLERLKRPDALVTAPEGRQAQLELERLQAQLDDALESFDAGKITATMLGRVEARLLPKITRAEADAAAEQLPRTGPVVKLVGHVDVEARWSELTPAERVEVMDALGLRVRILRGKPGPGFDPSTVEITWETR